MKNQYRKKAVVISAVQWGGILTDEVSALMNESDRQIQVTTDGKLEITTLEGVMTADVDDFIIKGIQGEFYPCKPDIFYKTYDEADAPHTDLTFGAALEMLKQGAKIARTGWNGSGMFVYLVDGSQFTVNRAPLNKIYPEGTEINYRPHMDIKTADGSCGTWAPSNSDTLAEDWLIVE
ncbi:MAG: DUF2829 domain-containing protein [Hyphomicrobiales bacterium]